MKCDETVKDTRPVNLDIGTIDLPLPALTSIMHRISGVIAVVTVGALLWLLDLSLSGEEGFRRAAAVLDLLLVKVILWGLLVALIYHTAAGIRHLVMDLGYGENFEAGVASSKLVYAVTVILAILVGVWLW